MTEEQAIKGLKENLCSLCAYGSQNMDSCDIRECDNRDYIKALEQQPCDDCVSRAEMLKYQQYLRGKMSNEENHKLWKFIKNLPPVTPTFPKGATNGDMIKAMFPYGKYGTNGNEVHVYGVGGNGCLVFTLDWWNAPYKRGGENGSN